MFTYKNIQSFNDTEMSLYKYIIANGSQVPYMTIRELAKEVHLSPSTILRFCSKVQCDGYSEFKEKLRTDINNIQDMPPQDDLSEILEYFKRVNTHGFEQKIIEGAKIISGYKKVVFVGLGSSGTLARYGARYFSNVGKHAIGLEDPYYPITEEFAKDCSFIILSVSGETKEIIEFIDKIQGSHSRILSITNESTSTIARMSDWNISYNLRDLRLIDRFNATTQVPVLFLMEALARRL